MGNKIPEEYFCPNCNTKMVEDLVAKFKKAKMPSVLIVNMGVEILNAAGCPHSLTRPIFEWVHQYGENTLELNEAEKDKLKLIKWQEWARS
jgi:hypothetical protein